MIYTLATGMHDDTKRNISAAIVTFILAAALPIITALLTVNRGPLHVGTLGASSQSTDAASDNAEQGAQTGGSDQTSTETGTNPAAATQQPDTNGIASTAAGGASDGTTPLTAATSPPIQPVGGYGGGTTGTITDPTTCSCQSSGTDTTGGGTTDGGGGGSSGGGGGTGTDTTTDPLLQVSTPIIETQIQSIEEPVPSVTVTSPL